MQIIKTLQLRKNVLIRINHACLRSKSNKRCKHFLASIATLKRPIVWAIGASFATTLVTTNAATLLDENLNLLNFDEQFQANIIESGLSKATLLNANERFGRGKVLDIKFSSKARLSGVRLVPKTPWDWSDLDEYNLSFDVYNPSDESVQLYLSLTDKRGQTLGDKVLGHRAVTGNRSVAIAPEKRTTIFTILAGQFTETDAGIREKPKPWNTKELMAVWRYGEADVNLGEISEIGLFVRGNLTDKHLQIDNIRLRPNPKYTDEYLSNFVDRFGQNANVDYPTKIHSEADLKRAAEVELARLDKSSLMPDRSKFGGWKDGPKFDATGYFRTKKINDQWWMIDPEGYLFFSHGVANVRMANLTTVTGIDFEDQGVRVVDPDEVTPEDSIGIIQVSDKVRESRYVRSALRNNMFKWLPDYSEDLAAHYSYRRKVHRGPVDSGETFSFYRANLERRYGEDAPNSYIRKWEEVTLQRMQDWGFTSMGNWVDPAFYPNQKVPYFANGWIIGEFQTLVSEHDVWSPMPDPFDPDFIKRAKITIDIIAKEIQGSPWCVGIFVDNEKSWGFREGSLSQRFGVVLNALSKDASNSPAKTAFVAFLKNRHTSIQALNTSWGAQYNSWSELASGRPHEHHNSGFSKDLSSLLELLSEQYFSVVHGAVEKALPHHLYMGARMANFGMPNETIKASVKYSDVLSFNIYEEGIQPHDWAFLSEIDLPSVIGEFHIGAFDETGLFHPGLVQATNQVDRANKYYDYMESVASHKNMVGAHWFQYIDSPITGRAFDGEPYNVGFVSGTDIPYPEMVEAAKRFNASLYPKRFNLRGLENEANAAANNKQ